MQIVICDSDLKNAEKFFKLLEESAKERKINLDIEKTSSGKELLFFVESKYANADIIYIANNIKDPDSIEVATELRKNGMVADIIFYATDDKRAVEGYDVEALHYLVDGKIDKKKFKEVLDKAIYRANKRKSEVISLSCAGEHRNIDILDIMYFEVQNRIITVHYVYGGEETTFEFYSSLSKLEEFLYGKGFSRIHSSFLVADKFVKKASTRDVQMSNGMVFPIGRSYKKNLSF